MSNIYVDIRNDFSYGPLYEGGVRVPTFIKDDMLATTDIDGIDSRKYLPEDIEHGTATRLATVTLSTAGGVTVNILESDAVGDEAVRGAIKEAIKDLRDVWAEYVHDQHSDAPEGQPYIAIGSCFVPISELKVKYCQPEGVKVKAFFIHPNRQQELLNILIDNMCNEEGGHGGHVCKRLYDLGFSEEELSALNFCESDIEDAVTASSGEEGAD